MIRQTHTNASALLRASVLVALLAFGAAPASPQGSEGPAISPTSAEAFLTLRWLEGSWRGTMPDGTPFYERYTLVDDSTFAVESFADSALTAPRSIGTVALRGGAVYRVESSGQRVPLTRHDAAGALFGSTDRGFTWAPQPDGSWTASIHSKGRGDIVYHMRPVRAAPGVEPPESADRSAVERAVLDYVDALYRVEPERIERSVHPALAKRGFFMREGGYAELTMTFDELRSLAGRWNHAGRVDPETAVKEIVVLDLLDQTASAKLTAAWGVDYLHLARYDGVWQIVNVLWQSPPPPAER